MTENVASVFISYAHADRPLARSLAEGLRAGGCRVWVDEGELRVGDSLVEAISEALERVDFVAVLISEASVGSNWCRKEVSLAMTGEINNQGITVLPLRVDGTPMPDTLKDKLYLDVARDGIDAAVENLMRDIHRHLTPAQALPPRRRQPVRQTPAATSSAAGPRPASDIRITGIDTDRITSPRNDGTKGSALYSVPFTLSRSPGPRWAVHLVENWNHPAQFTTMHRAGIARVEGSRIILDGTTIDEVEKYHLSTLKLAVDAANRSTAIELERDRVSEQTRDEAAADQAREIAATLKRLDF